MMKWKRIIALLLSALLCVSLLGACSQPEQETEEEPLATLHNDGREVVLVLGVLQPDDRRTAVLTEIAEKYQADFPNTNIEIRAFSGESELENALKAGEVDIGEINSGHQVALVQEGALADIYPYMTVWKESATLTQAARTAVGSMGLLHTYLIPNDFVQELLYYRLDWFEEYNADKEIRDYVNCRTWNEISGGVNAYGDPVTGAIDRLGDRGLLAFAGRDRLGFYFDAIVWSSLNQSRLADPGAAYYSLAAEGKSIFSTEKASAGADQFLHVMTMALEGTTDWTTDQAIQAFQEGKAGLLLAPRAISETLRETMPEGSWAMGAFPRGLSGTASFSPEYFVGWGVSSKAKEEEIAVHFLTFLSNADNNTHYAKECGTLPIHLEASALEESLTEGNLATEIEMAGRGDWYRYAVPPAMYQAYEGFREQQEEKLRRFIAGELSKEDLLNWLDEYWNTAYEKEGKLW
ncbi:MAG: extracellular solute-binding protein [Acutalibacter sp.]|nr:extracellular solute-binding protein [Acutalibacter sp.]